MNNSGIPYKDAVYNLMEYFKIDEDLAEESWS